MTTETLAHLIPEFALIGAATLIYLLGAFIPAPEGSPWRKLWVLLAVLALAKAAYFLWHPWMAAPEAGPVVADLFSEYARWLTLAVGLLLVLLAAKPGAQAATAEFQATLLMAIAGVMIVASARELVLIFLGLELVSIPTYVLLYLGGRGAGPQESAVKYFYLSILSSAVLLYGFSFLYGAAGSTDLTVLRETLARGPEEIGGAQLMALLALVLVMAGLGFRITAVPFHFYAPDVYQGTTNANAGILSVLPKIVGFVALVRIVSVAMPGLEVFGWRIALILSMLTMTLGNVLALFQDNVRRLLAYSSIAHAGYMLIGITVGFATAHGNDASNVFDGTGAMLFYLTVYAIATTGIFAALTYLGTPDRQVNDVDELAGLGRTQPLAALALAIFLFSLAGIPPLAGFWGKLTLFSAALENALGINVATGQAGAASLRNWLIALAIVGALNAATAAAYYLRLVAVMYFRPSVSVVKAQGGAGAAVAMALCALVVVGVGVYPVPLVRDSDAASRTAYALTPAARVVATEPAATHVDAGTQAVADASVVGSSVAD
ncbi:MAG TPA: NADH-quinone oxidoreductase subunit N [Pirellulales bacterium]|nr:NADH-quinone oxidoreductase subunit N [Pirellulales bacterium]